MPASYSAGQSLTEDLFLGGRVRLLQPASGFRSGMEPVLLAASVPARPGQRVLEGGSGTGAGLLCLAARVGGIEGVGVEQDAALAALASRNAAANGLSGLSFVAGDVLSETDLGRFDHAFANPPYHPPQGTHSPDPARDAAKRGYPGLLEGWAHALGTGLRYHGTLTFIVPAWALADTLAAFAAARCRARAVLPLWPRAGRPAKLAVIQGVKQGRTPLRLLPGLALHAESARFTAQAESVLRDGGGLVLE
jgi:tRNA1(Val) A37 N6-methylase TrmN6